MNTTIQKQKKDNRVAYNNQRIELEGNVVTFNGKYNPATGVLKVYIMRGDVSLFDQAIQGFCIDKGYEKATTHFHY